MQNRVRKFLGQQIKNPKLGLSGLNQNNDQVKMSHASSNTDARSVNQNTTISFEPKQNKSPRHTETQTSINQLAIYHWKFEDYI